MHLARHWGQRWTVAFHKTSSNPFRYGYGSKSWYSMGFHDSFHIKICRLLRNYGCWFIHVPVHTRFLFVFLIRMRHYHRSVSGCFRLAASTSWKSQFPLAILSLSLFFPHFGSKPYAHKFRRASWHLPKLHGNPTQTLCFPFRFPRACMGLWWEFYGLLMTFVIGRPLPLWINPPSSWGDTPARKRNGVPGRCSLPGDAYVHPITPFSILNVQFMGIAWGFGGLMGVSPNLGMSVGVWWGFGGGLVVAFETEQEQCQLQQPKFGNCTGVWWGFGDGIWDRRRTMPLRQSAAQTWAWHGYGY